MPRSIEPIRYIKASDPTETLSFVNRNSYSFSILTILIISTSQILELAEKQSFNARVVLSEVEEIQWSIENLKTKTPF